MKRDQFLSSVQLKLNLLSMQKKMLQLHHRFIIQVITDNQVEQVKKTYREFQYFSKILRNKLGLKDKQLTLQKHFRSNNNYKDLELYISRLNCGYLIYRSKKDMEARRNAESNIIENTKADVLQLEPIKTRELRGYLYDLLFKEDELFVDGVDDYSQDEEVANKASKIQPVNLKSSYKSQEEFEVPNDEKPKASRNLFKKLFTTMHEKVDNKEKNQQVSSKAQLYNTLQAAEKSKIRSKSNSLGKLQKAILGLKNKAKGAGQKAINVYENHAQGNSLKNILKSITSCWIKFPNSYQKRDRNVIYKPYIWQHYDVRLGQNTIQFINKQSVHKHRKIFVLFQSDVELNFDEYTKLIIKNKIDKNPLQIRLSLDESFSQMTQQYLALYTYIKQAIKQQEEKLKQLPPTGKFAKVCNKVRVRINLKPVIEKSSSLTHQNMKTQAQNLSKTRGSSLLVNIPHNQYKNDQKQLFEFRQLRQVSDNLRNVNIKIVHGLINISVSITLDTYVDIDFPILDNFGALDISLIQIAKEGFLPNIGAKDAFCTFHIPVQTIYDYMYNYDMPKKKKQTQIKNKMLQIKNTKVTLTVDYKGIGNYKAMCGYNPNDIYEQDGPPQQFNRDELRMNKNRLQRIVWSTELYLDKLKDLKNFTFPNLSYLFYMFLAVSCLFYDNNNFLLWVFVFLLSVLFYNSPAYSIYIRDIVDFLKIKAKKSKVDVFLFKKNKLVEAIYVIPTKTALKMNFLDQFQLTRKVKRSMYKKYKRLFQVLLQAQIVLTQLVTIIEKVKNIFTWYHYQKTRLFFLILAGCVFALLILPVRLILFCVLLKMMLKGAKYHANIQDINKVIIIELIRIIIRENNFSYMSLFFREHFRPFDFQSSETVLFFKTCNQLISNWLEVQIKIDEVVKKSNNMTQFMVNLSKCKTKYKIRKQICQQFGFSLQWSKTQSSLKKYFQLIYGFIVTVPSDKYLLGVKTVKNDEEEIDEAQNIIDKELLNF